MLTKWLLYIHSKRKFKKVKIYKYTFGFEKKICFCIYFFEWIIWNFFERHEPHSSRLFVEIISLDILLFYFSFWRKKKYIYLLQDIDNRRPPIVVQKKKKKNIIKKLFDCLNVLYILATWNPFKLLSDFGWHRHSIFWLFPTNKFTLVLWNYCVSSERQFIIFFYHFYFIFLILYICKDLRERENENKDL